jgi:hypothetical protein
VGGVPRPPGQPAAPPQLPGSGNEPLRGPDFR